MIQMIFNSIRIQNFLSIQDITLPLDNQGLVLLNGKNLDNNSLNNNGAGKSSILEAIVYALYGRTLRGLKGDAVVHRLVDKNMSVELTLTDDDNSVYRIARYRKHHLNKNKSLLYRNGTDITPKSEADFDAYVTNLLQADYNTFTASLLYSAESFKFSTATDSEIKKTFDTMLDLDVLSTASFITRQRIRAISSEVKMLQNNLEHDKSTEDRLKQQIYDTETAQQAFTNDKAAKITQFQQSILVLQEKSSLLLAEQSALQDTLNNYESDWNLAIKTVKLKDAELKQIDELRTETKKVETQISDIALKVTGKKNSLDINNKESARLQRLNDTLQQKLDTLEEKKQQLNEQIGQPCPTCGAPLTVEKIKPARRQYNKEIADVFQEMSTNTQLMADTEMDSAAILQEISELEEQKWNLIDTQKKFQNLLDLCKDSEEDREKAISQRDYLLQQVCDYRSKLQIKSTEISHNQELLKQTQDNLEDTMTAINPYAEILHSLRTALQQIQEKTTVANQQLIQKQELQTCLQFWDEAFSNKGIKSYILDDITPFLNRRVNKYLTKLAAGQIEAIFSTRTTLKSGDVTERFSLTINNKDGGDQYQANSGGERKRIDLAINLALQDLVASRSTKKINIAIFDEVFDALDENGIDSVISLLQELSQEKSTILVVSHNEHLQSYFSNCITVVKQNGFSSLDV